MLQTAAKIPISGDRTQTFKRMSGRLTWIVMKICLTIRVMHTTEKRFRPEWDLKPMTSAMPVQCAIPTILSNHLGAGHL